MSLAGGVNVTALRKGHRVPRHTSTWIEGPRFSRFLLSTGAASGPKALLHDRPAPPPSTPSNWRT
jgi:hypothetical protein